MVFDSEDIKLTKVYKNKNSINFKLDIYKADVPTDADYFAFLIKAKLEDNDKVYEYKALVKKSICPNEDKAFQWLKITGFNFMYEILDTYNQGKTLLLFPNSAGNWYII